MHVEWNACPKLLPLDMTSFSSLVQVEMLHEDRATPSGRGEEFRADAPLSSSKLGEARPEVCLLVYAGPCM